MTILIRGTLNINTRGVAMLHCDVGCFLVEHAALKDVVVGKHTGFFEIQKIQPHVTGSSPSQFQVILRATLKHFALQQATATAASVDTTSAKPAYQQTLLFVDADTASDSSEVVSDEVAIGEDDPSTMDLSSALITTVNSEDVAAQAETVEETVTSSQDALLLSDTLLPNLSASLPKEVELDPTLPREQLREKMQQLKARGYRFNPERQVWQLAA